MNFSAKSLINVMKDFIEEQIELGYLSRDNKPKILESTAIERIKENWKPYDPEVEWLKTIICAQLTTKHYAVAILSPKHKENLLYLSITLWNIFILVIVASVYYFVGYQIALCIYFGWNVFLSIGIKEVVRYRNLIDLYKSI